MASAKRRPGRHRTVTKYTEDAFEAAGLPVDEPGIIDPRLRTHHDDSDEEFELGADERAEAISDHDDIIPEDDASEEAEISGSGEEPTSDLEDEALEQDFEANFSGGRDALHSSGINRTVYHHSKYMRMKFAFGSGQNELLPIIHARENWSGPWDLTFPSKRSLKRARKSPSYGTGATFGVEPELLSQEASKGWDWYYDDDVEFSFRKRQRVERVGIDVAQSYLPLGKTAHTVIVGPSGNETAFQLGRGESVNFGEAWGMTEYMQPKIKKKLGRPRKHSIPEPPPPKPQIELPKVKIREGWIINMGNRVQALAWAPNCSGTQFLAVAVPVLNQQKDTHSVEGQTAAAFTPSPPHPTAIQIWSFESKEDKGLRKLDLDVKPRLRMTLCTDAGDIAQLAWCPMSRDRRPDDETEDRINLGLLAGIWRDGTVKVLDVTLSKAADGVDLVRVQTPSFEAKPPSTLCTCLTWLSPSDIAAGCANGFVAVWNIARSSSQQPGSLTPYIYTPNQKSYILSIASAYPSYPHIVMTSDIDGEGRMFSLLHPTADTTDFPRQRMGSLDVTYSPFLRSFVSTNENGAIRTLPVRRFFSGVNSLRHESLITSTAPCSSFHPSFLVGTAGGDAISSNPLRKLTSSRERIWQQTWFVHEWVPGKPQIQAAKGPTIEIKEDAGVSRFYDGFKAEKPLLSTNSTTLDLNIFEEGTAVTALAWNPNQEFAGWACAGLGCGLVRVEDLSH